MKKQLKRIISLSLALALVFCLAGTAMADFSSFRDVRGHWAEETLKQAYKDGLIKGYSSTQMAPNDAISKAQMITILCRVLGADKKADISGIGIGPGAWFYEAAAQAAYLGFLTSGDNMNGSMSRLDVMLMLADAFQIEEADPDDSAARAYPDYSGLSGKAARVVAALVDDGIVQGFGGSLMLKSSISRAEFLTMLYRLVENYVPAGGSEPLHDGGSVFYGDISLAGQSFDGSIWAGCTSGRISLSGVQADSLVIRSDRLESLSISGSTELDRLVLAQSSGDISVSPSFGASVGTVNVGTGAGRVSINGSVANAEVTGDGRSVTVGTSVEKLYITGKSNSVTVSSGVTVKELVISGSGNTVTINGTVYSGAVNASGCTLNGYGRISSLTLKYRASVTVSAGSTTDTADHGIENAAVSISMERTSFSVGDTMVATARITAPVSGKSCTGTWFVGGVARQSETIALESGKTNTLACDVRYISGMGDTLPVSFVLSYTTAEGEKQEVASNTIDIAVDVDEYLTSAERVLKLVTTGYKGNRTLKWAEENDYQDFEKEIWINAKGYSSRTDYLVWISIAYQRVNVFKGSKGNWTLEKSFIVGTGANGTNTPVGVYTVTYKQSYGWTTSTYTCAPVVGWKYNSGYAFHSRLYRPGSSTSNDANLIDATIGMPCSHGCIRMYTPDIWWIYDNVPVGSTVVSY